MNLPWLCILNLCDLIMWPVRSTFQAFKLTFKLYTRLSLVSLCPRRRRPFAPFLCLYIYRRSPRQWLASATSRCSAAAGQMLPWRRRVPGIVHQQVHRVHLNRLPCCMPGADSPPGTAACFVSKGWEVGRLLCPFLTGLRLAESGLMDELQDAVQALSGAFEPLAASAAKGSVIDSACQKQTFPVLVVQAPRRRGEFLSPILERSRPQSPSHESWQS